MISEWTLPKAVRISDGTETVETSSVPRVVSVLRNLEQRAEKASKDAKDAYVRLGRVLLDLRNVLPRGVWSRLLEEAGLHRKRVERAIRLAAKCADADGCIDGEKVAQFIREAKNAGRIPSDVSETNPPIRMMERAIAQPTPELYGTRVYRKVRDTQTDSRTEDSSTGTHGSLYVRETQTESYVDDDDDFDSGAWDEAPETFIEDVPDVAECVAEIAPAGVAPSAGAAGEQLMLEGEYQLVREAISSIDELARMVTRSERGELARELWRLRERFGGAQGGGSGGGKQDSLSPPVSPRA